MLRRLLRLTVAVFAPVLIIAATVAGPAPAASPNLVISQVYGGGGNAGAPYQNDFVELFNRSALPVALDGLSLQYASATGTGNFGANSGQITTELTGVVAPYGYVLVQEASNAAVGAPLAADIVDPTPINMSGTAGKVALVTGTTTLGCNTAANCSLAALARIVDLVGYGGANFFEGSGAAPTLSNTTSALRVDGGCKDTDNNAADFLAGAPTPRNRMAAPHMCLTDDAPSVASTNPDDHAADVPVDANVSITFSEPVDVSGSWYAIDCPTSGAHTATVSGGPSTFTLDPDSNFAQAETCTVTVRAANVTDQDTNDPPDAMSADYAFSFTTVQPPVAIHDIQGRSHISPKVGQLVSGVTGVVTGKLANGFYMQDPNPDSDPATSEGIFVFTSSPPTAVSLGDALRVAGRVSEFRPGGSANGNLTTTEISSPSIAVLSSGNALPAVTVAGTGGRIPPSAVVEDDASGSVETSGTFDPENDGLDFWESLEAMRVQVNNPVAVGPSNTFGELTVVGDDGANAGPRTPRGGVRLTETDGNGERITLDDQILPTPTPVNVGDHFTGPAVGIVNYNFGLFMLELTQPIGRVDEHLPKEATAPAGPRDLSVATFNVENLDPGDGPAKFDTLAHLIVDNLEAPDLVTLEEVQDNDGEAGTGVTNSDLTLDTLVAAISAAGGPAYAYTYIEPAYNQDGGAPGGNIRIAFIWRADRGLEFVGGTKGGTTEANSVVTGPDGKPHLALNPGRIDPTNPAWGSSRKPLAAEFRFRGKQFFVIGNHFNSKGGDDPLTGRFQPPMRSSEVQRHQQAQVVNDFVDAIVAADANANVVVLGDLNDFQWSETAHILEGGVLKDMIDALPENERYSYDFEGNAQVLDHILVSNGLFAKAPTFDVVHVNSEFADQASDHDPSVLHVILNTPPKVKPAGRPPERGRHHDVDGRRDR
jgi:hypothetical protein